MRAAIYCRVSTEDQEREGTSLQTQLDACLAYCQQKGYQVSRRFSETYSGLTLERPKLDELRDLIRNNEIDVVIVYCLDRLSRDPTHGVILTQELEKHHITLEAVTETVESTELGKLINYIRGYASKVEAEKIRERTMRGKLARLKQGRLPQGTGIGIYGYQWDKETGCRTVIDSEAKVVQNIFAMVLQGFSFIKIAKELNVAGVKSKSGSMWNTTTIKRMVTNEAYMGKTYSHKQKRISKAKVISRPKEEWILLRNITPPIISEEMFNRTQEVLRQAKQARPIRQNSPYLLTGFIKCSKCGSPICGSTLNGKYRYYQCTGARPTATRGKICNCGYIRANDLEASIWDRIIVMLSHPNTILKLIVDFQEFEKERTEDENILPIIEKQIEQLRKNLKTYPSKERALYDLLTSEAVTKDILLDALNKLKQERLNDDHQLDNLLLAREQAKSKWTKLEFDELTNIIVSEILNSTHTTGARTDNLLEKRRLLEGIRLEITADPDNYEFNFKLGCFLISTQNYYRPDTVTEDELAQLKEKYGEEFYAPTETELAELEKAWAEEKKRTQTSNPVFEMTYSFNRPLAVLQNYLKNLVITQQTSLCS